MSYNNQAFKPYMQTAGKVSVLAAIVGLAVFIFAFIVDVGHQELQKVSAQSGTASTSLTVLNTPPVFVVNPYEVTPSSTTTPTNSGSAVTWSAIANDANGADYYLLVCNQNVTPIPTNGGVPSCGTGAIQWGVSAATVSDALATVSTTTVEEADNASTPFDETNDWYAWVCDGDITQAACSVAPSQGSFATSSSPFNMNQRPVLTSATPAGGVDPGGTLTFNSVSSDVDVVDAADNLFLIVCTNPGDYNAATDTCDNNFIASTTVGVTTNVSAATTTAAILRDGVFNAHAFLIDQHGHEATANFTVDFTVNNVAPTVLSGDIVINGGNDIILTNASGGETTGFGLEFTVTDANSCVNTSGTPGSEIIGFEAAVFRTSIGTTTGSGCNPADASYNPNFCYESSQAPGAWNLNCTASSTSCTGATDSTQLFECTFPLWFVADPTDIGPHAADSWSAAIAGGDDNFATSSLVIGSTPVSLIANTFFNLVTAVIPYGALAPGSDTGTLATSTVVENLSNAQLDQELDGSAMCPTFVSTSTDCSLTSDSTVFTSNQKFATSAVAYASPLATELPTTTIATSAELDLNVLETTATSTPAEGETFWGIAVPSSITVAGTYTGLNTFLGILDAGW